jgi:predicted DNA-binding protein
LRQIQQLTKLAKTTGLTLAELVRRAIDEYLERKQR